MDEFNPTTRSRGYAAHLYTLDLASAQFVGHVAYTWNNREAQITGCQFSPQGNRIAVLIVPTGPTIRNA